MVFTRQHPRGSFMQCIPTFAVMDAIDPELAIAKRRLAAYFEETGGAVGHGADSAALWPNSVMTYLCSIPRRQDNGAILYVHVFQHDRATAAEGYFSVLASPRWWPVDCQSLQPQRRSQSRAALRLVS
jgi:hypothetical protein